jgi:hypothetical protein
MSDRTLVRILAVFGLIGVVAGARVYRSYRAKRVARELVKMEPDQSAEVETASEDSFPASDAPAWTGTGV